MRTFKEIEENVLAEHFEGYTPRVAQQDVARFIEGAIHDRAHGMIQAPVGTGKSLGALIPAINYVLANPGKRILVATATNLLGRQYNDKDLPMLQKMYEETLGESFTYALVKGRSHYVCNWNLSENADLPSTVDIMKELESHPGHSGDFDDFKFNIPQEDKRKLSVSSSECPGMKSCAIAKQVGCFSTAARIRAQDAQIVITNISSLVTNARLQGNLLGDYDLIIVDEAHNLDQYTLGVMEESLNFEGMRRLINQAEPYFELRNKEDVLGSIDQMEQDALQMIGEETFRKITEQDIIDNVDPFIPVYQGMMQLKGQLGAQASSALKTIEEAEEEGSEIENKGWVEDVARNAKRLAKQAANYVTVMGMLLPIEQDEEIDDEQINVGFGQDHVRWISSTEVSRGRKKERRVKYHTSPIETADFLRRYVWNGKEDEILPPAILMSGTLAPGGDFKYIKRTLGAPKDIRTIVVDSPFDFPSQGMLYVPEKGSPEPNWQDMEKWQQWYAESVQKVVEASKGDALLLFTSRRNMEAAYEALAPVFNRFGYKCMVQDGDRTTSELSRDFMDTPGSVLFGLKSFFEGFDPKKGKVKALVIDKLPFPVPSDIIFEARSQKINHEMRDNWASLHQLSIPLMSLTLDQGVGRLIRSKDHEGVVCLMDVRLTTKNYGPRIVKALPPFARANTLDDVIGRLTEIA